MICLLDWNTHPVTLATQVTLIQDSKGQKFSSYLGWDDMFTWLKYKLVTLATQVTLGQDYNGHYSSQVTGDEIIFYLIDLVIQSWKSLENNKKQKESNKKSYVVCT